MGKNGFQRTYFFIMLSALAKMVKNLLVIKFRSMYTNSDELLEQYLAENPVAKKRMG